MEAGSASHCGPAEQALSLPGRKIRRADRVVARPHRSSGAIALGLDPVTRRSNDLLKCCHLTGDRVDRVADTWIAAMGKLVERGEANAMQRPDG
jgi:hypothetical protein